MMLSQILSPQRVFLDLSPQPKEELLRALADRLAALGEIADPAALTERLIARERMITTAVKRGFAFPHAFSPQTKHLILTVARVPNGTDYESLDGEPVELIFLLLGPETRQDVHLRVLARLSSIARQPGTLEALRGAGTAEEVVDFLNRNDPA